MLMQNFGGQVKSIMVFFLKWSIKAKGFLILIPSPLLVHSITNLRKFFFDGRWISGIDKHEKTDVHYR